MQIQKEEHLQGFRLTQFGKALIASLAVLLVISFIIIYSLTGRDRVTPSNIQSSNPGMTGLSANGTNSIQNIPCVPQSQLDENLKNVSLSIYFYPNSPEIKSESYQTLNAIAALSNTSEDVTLQIEGNTAKVMNAQDSQFDEDLCRKRAEAVAGYLSKKGISSGRFNIISNGSNKPAKSNDTESGRKLNRRADIYFK